MRCAIMEISNSEGRYGVIKGLSFFHREFCVRYCFFMYDKSMEEVSYGGKGVSQMQTTDSLDKWSSIRMLQS